MLDIRNVVSVGGTDLNTSNDLTVDTELSTTSNNPVTNKAITQAILGKQDALTVAQQSAVDSGINATKVTAFQNHIDNSAIHVTSSDKSAWDAKQDPISDLNTIRSGAAAGATAVQSSDLATVATTGNYSDLSGTPGAATTSTLGLVKVDGSTVTISDGVISAASSTPDGVYTRTNLVAGTNISITQVPQPVIDENTLGVWHLENNTDNAVSGSAVSLYSSGSYGFAKTFSDSFSKFGSYSAKGYSDTNTNIFSGVDFTSVENITFDCWMRTPTTDPGVFPAISCLVEYSNPKIRIVSRYNKILITTTGETTGDIADIPVDSGSWHHIAVEYMSTTLNIYVDGEKKYAGTHQTSNRALKFFQGTYGKTYYDEIRLSNIARYQGQNFTPFTQPYSASAGDPKYKINNTQDSLPSQTGNSGKYLTTDGTDASWATVNALQNLATGSNALTLIGQASTKSNSINFGYYSYVSKDDAIAIGSYTYATGDKSIAIGPASSSLNTNTQASATDAIAIGKYARASASSAVQLGTGTNSTASTLQFLNTTVVNASGKVPTASIDFAGITGYDASKTQVLKNVNGTLTWVDEA